MKKKFVKKSNKFNLKKFSRGASNFFYTLYVIRGNFLSWFELHFFEGKDNRVAKEEFFSDRKSEIEKVHTKLMISENIHIFSPPGSGKTEVAKAAANLSKMKLVEFDIKRITASQYIEKQIIKDSPLFFRSRRLMKKAIVFFFKFFLPTYISFGILYFTVILDSSNFLKNNEVWTYLIFFIFLIIYFFIFVILLLLSLRFIKFVILLSEINFVKENDLAIDAIWILKDYFPRQIFILESSSSKIPEYLLNKWDFFSISLHENASKVRLIDKAIKKISEKISVEKTKSRNLIHKSWINQVDYISKNKDSFNLIVNKMRYRDVDRVLKSFEDSFFYYKSEISLFDYFCLSFLKIEFQLIWDFIFDKYELTSKLIQQMSLPGNSRIVSEKEEKTYNDELQKLIDDKKMDLDILNFFIDNKFMYLSAESKRRHGINLFIGNNNKNTFDYSFSNKEYYTRYKSIFNFTILDSDVLPIFSKSFPKWLKLVSNGNFTPKESHFKQFTDEECIKAFKYVKNTDYKKYRGFFDIFSKSYIGSPENFIMLIYKTRKNIDEFLRSLSKEDRIFFAQYLLENSAYSPDEARKALHLYDLKEFDLESVVCNFKIPFHMYLGNNNSYTVDFFDWNEYVSKLLDLDKLFVICKIFIWESSSSLGPEWFIIDRSTFSNQTINKIIDSLSKKVELFSVYSYDKSVSYKDFIKIYGPTDLKRENRLKEFGYTFK